MRLVSKIHFVFVLTMLSEPIAAQLLEKSIAVRFSDIPVEEALFTIETKANLTFSYSPSNLPLYQNVTYSTPGSPVRIVLDNILDKGFVYKERGSYVIILPDHSTTEKTEVSLSGIVRDKRSNQKIQNVTVYEVRTLTSGLTDSSGNYQIDVKSKDEYIHLAISAKNYRDTVVRISKLDPKPLDIVLAPRIDSTIPMELREIDTSGLVRFFVKNEMFQNLKNVFLSEQRLGQISFLPILGTNRKLSGLVSNKVSINMLAGYSYGVDAVEVGGLVNIVRNHVNGVQAAGIGNTVGGPLSGVQAAGIFNANLDTVQGVQIGGIFNTAGHYMSGVQAGGIFNTVVGNAYGCQVGGIFNFNLGTMNGFQGGGIFNINGGKTNGCQVGGIFNVVRDTIHGAQIGGIFNSAEAVDGTQISGIFNKAGYVKGVQIGLVNFADSLDGVAIGLINVAKNGMFELALESSDVSQAGLALRMGIEKFYSFLATGARFYENDFHLVAGGGFGSMRYLNKHLSMGAELSTHNFISFNTSGDSLNMVNKFGLNLGYHIHKNLALHGGPVLNIGISDQYNADSGTYGMPLQIHPFYNKTRNGTNLKLWVGYAFSVRF